MNRKNLRRGMILILWIISLAAFSYAGSVEYEYDDLGRLVRASYQNGAENREFSYSYDNTGNRTGKTVSGAFVSPYPYGTCDYFCNGTYDSRGCFPSYAEALRARNSDILCNTDLMLESPVRTYGYLESAVLYCPYAPSNSGLTCTITNPDASYTFIFYYH